MNVKILNRYMKEMKKFEKYGIEPTFGGLIAYKEGIEDGSIF